MLLEISSLGSNNADNIIENIRNKYKRRKFDSTCTYIEVSAGNFSTFEHSKMIESIITPIEPF